MWQEYSSYFTPLNALLAYLVGINFVAFLAYGFDKWAARAGWWRVRERTLLLCALLGGSLGAALGMNYFRHKTKKESFFLWVLFIIALQIAVFGYLFFRFFLPEQST